jgi:hypothetical protein
MKKKIVWITAEGRHTLAARVRWVPCPDRTFLIGIGEDDMDPIQAWCEEHGCGVRVSFDQFRFRNKREITVFLLRWT